MARVGLQIACLTKFPERCRSKSLHRTVEDWLLEGADNRKLLIALHLDAYPFIDSDEMTRVLTDLAERNPRVAPRCKLLIQSRASTAEVFSHNG